MNVDTTDAKIVRFFTDSPRASVLEASRVLKIARATVQSRLDRMARLGVITGFAPDVSPAALGFSALCYVRLNLAQGVLDEVTEKLVEIPEVIQVDSVAGDADLMCHVVSTGPENTEEVIQRILAVPGVLRSRTEPVLRRRVPHRVHPLIARLLRDYSEA